jgi:hypothetical protein
MKFKAISEIVDYFWDQLPEDSNIVSIDCTFDDFYREGLVIGFDAEDDCDVVIGSFVKRWKSYYV